MPKSKPKTPSAKMRKKKKKEYYSKPKVLKEMESDRTIDFDEQQKLLDAGVITQEDIDSGFGFKDGGSVEGKRLTKTVPPQKGPNSQGMRGTGAAIRGTKFKGVF
jgi:hypothetical protein